MFIEVRLLNRFCLLLTFSVVHCIFDTNGIPTSKVIACAMHVMCVKEFAIEQCYIFYIIANMGF